MIWNEGFYEREHWPSAVSAAGRFRVDRFLNQGSSAFFGGEAETTVFQRPRGEGGQNSQARGQASEGGDHLVR